MKILTRSLSLLLTLSLMTPLCLNAAEKSWSWSDWLKEIQSKVRRLETKRKNKIAASAAIRGAETRGDGSSGLYWKGEKKSEPLSMTEFEEFKQALALVEEGKKDEGKKSLEAFIEAHPESPMTSDARQTLALLDKAPLPSSTE